MQAKQTCKEEHEKGDSLVNHMWLGSGQKMEN